MTVDSGNKFCPRKILCQIVKDMENVAGSMDRNHSCKSATFPTPKTQLIDNNYTYSNLQLKFMEVGKLELIYNGTTSVIICH
jgi:hypothetical protein